MVLIIFGNNILRKCMLILYQISNSHSRSKQPRAVEQSSFHSMMVNLPWHRHRLGNSANLKMNQKTLTQCFFVFC